MKVLIVDDEEDLRDVVELCVESILDTEFVQAGTGNEAIKILKEDMGIDLVVCDYNMPDGNGGEVFLHLKNSESPVPFILCSTDTPEDHPEIAGSNLFGNVEKPRIHAPLSGLLEKFQEEKSGGEKGKSEYVRVRFGMFEKFFSFPCGVYKKKGDDSYQKIFYKGEVIKDPGDIQLFIERKDIRSFFDSFERKLEQILEKRDVESPEESIQISKEVDEIVGGLYNQFGWDETCEKFVKKSMDLTVKAVKKNPNVADFLKKITADPECYISSHSSLLSHIACGFAQTMGWTDEETYLKLSLAGMMHDLAIKGKQMDKVKSFNKLAKNKGLRDESDVANYVQHPQVAAEIIRGMHDIPDGVAEIVLQHHEQMDGSGFPQGLSHNQISDLSALFIIAEDVVDYIHQHPNDYDLDKYLNKISQKYILGTFKTIVQKLIFELVRKKATAA